MIFSLVIAVTYLYKLLFFIVMILLSVAGLGKAYDLVNFFFVKNFFATNYLVKKVTFISHNV